MNSILNKIFRVVTASILCLIIAFSITACNKVPKNLDESSQVCVSGALYESWMYVFTDESFINEVVSIFDSVNTKKSDEVVDMMTAGEVLSFTFSAGEETLGKIIVDSNNRLCYEAGEQSYMITSDFDFVSLKELVDDEIERVKATLNATTPDEL